MAKTGPSQSQSSTKRMAASTATPTAPASAPAINNDKAIARLLFAMLKQKSLKDIDWNLVAADAALLEPISNGHAARMRFSRYRNAVETSVNGGKSKTAKRAYRVTKRRSNPAAPVKDGDETEVDDSYDTKLCTRRHDDERDADGEADTTPKSLAEQTMSILAPKNNATGANAPNAPKIKAEPLANVSFASSTLPSPPMETEHAFDPVPQAPAAPNSRNLGLCLQDTPLFACEMPYQSELHVAKRRMASANNSAPMAQVPSAPAAALPRHHFDYGVGRIHSVPSMPLFAQQTQQQNQITMLRHHSANYLPSNPAHQTPLMATDLFGLNYAPASTIESTPTPHTQWTASPHVSPHLVDSMDVLDAGDMLDFEQQPSLFAVDDQTWMMQG